MSQDAKDTIEDSQGVSEETENLWQLRARRSGKSRKKQRLAREQRTNELRNISTTENEQVNISITSSSDTSGGESENRSGIDNASENGYSN